MQRGLREPWRIRAAPGLWTDGVTIETCREEADPKGETRDFGAIRVLLTYELGAGSIHFILWNVIEADGHPSLAFDPGRAT